MQIPAEQFNTDNDPAKLVTPDTVSPFEVERWLDAEAEWEKTLVVERQDADE